MYTVYLVTNVVNGKKYVGMTKTTLKERMHGHRYYKGSSLYEPIQEYGIDNFIVEVLFTTENKNQAIEKEIFFTLQFQSHKKEYGYNIAIGSSYFGRIVSEETKEKLSKSLKGKPGLCGEKNPNYGKHLSQETKEKISNSLKGRYVGEKNPNYGKHHTHETLEKVSGENHWTTRKSFSKEALQKKHDALYRKPSVQSRPVRCIETGEVLPFAKEFYYRYGHLDSKILDCCKGRRKTHHGLHWEYAD